MADLTLDPQNVVTGLWLCIAYMALILMQRQSPVTTMFCVVLMIFNSIYQTMHQNALKRLFGALQMP